jgi:hypothetical protein
MLFAMVCHTYNISILINSSTVTSRRSIPSPLTHIRKMTYVAFSKNHQCITCYELRLGCMAVAIILFYFLIAPNIGDMLSTQTITIIK